MPDKSWDRPTREAFLERKNIELLRVMDERESWKLTQADFFDEVHTIVWGMEITILNMGKRPKLNTTVEWL